jgi:surface polysaccharide O-acyltransferase-like enzyme
MVNKKNWPGILVPDAVMAFTVEENLSKRIHSLRFLLMVFVVFIHNTVIDVGVNFAEGKQIFEAPLYVVKIKQFAGTITCTAVPLFFLISGYLLFIKKTIFIKNLKKKCRTILLPYFLWIILILLLFALGQKLSITKPFFATLIINNFTLLEWIDLFVGKFTALSEYMYPLVYQFWFLRDLFILNLLYPIIKIFIDKYPGGTLFLFLLLWFGGVNIYIISPAALFFFSLGYYIVKYNINYKHIDNLKMMDMVIMYIITILASLFMYDHIPVISNINIIVGITFFVKLSYNFIKKDNIYKMLSWLEQYSFWLYATHGIFIAVLIKISVKIMPMNGVWLLVHYFAITILCIIILVGIGIIFKKIFPKIYNVLTGGRI